MKKLSLILPDIRSAFNVGSFFRTADGLGVDKIYLTGFTPYPPHIQIAKTALGAEDFVDWEYRIDLVTLIRELREDHCEIIALEDDFAAIELDEYVSSRDHICLIVGNEISGIDQSVLRLADKIVRISMKGKKESFNVAVAGGIALYYLKNHRR